MRCDSCTGARELLFDHVRARAHGRPRSRVPQVVEAAAEIARAATGDATSGVVEIAGPEAFGMDEFVRRGLAALHDPREVVTDPQAQYFGAVIDPRSLVPAGDAILTPTRFSDWVLRNADQG